jgi:ribose transport system substrate-binding protein
MKKHFPVAVGAVVALFSLIQHVPLAFAQDRVGQVRAVAVLLGDLGNPFFATVADAVEKEAKIDFGSDVTVTVASSGYDVGRQIKQIDDYVRKGYSLLILNAADSDQISDAVHQAIANGTVVVAVDVKGRWRPGDCHV